MLRYLGQGSRYYGQQPMAPQSRANWEFFAVVSGRCAPLLPGGEVLGRPELQSSTIWVFPPEHKHGWVGGKRPCKAVVLHFGVVFPLLAEITREHGFLQHKLSPAQARRIGKLAREMKPHYEKPMRLSPLYEQYAQLELALIALEGMVTTRLPTLASLAEQKVETAMLHFKDHLPERPAIARVARVAGVSPSHLRRLFIQVRNESPRDALRRVAMERAAELLSETSHTIAAIAEQCGFAGAGEFSRAFKFYYKMPPSVWREGILPPYRKPVNIQGHWQLPEDSSGVIQKMRRYGFHR